MVTESDLAKRLGVTRELIKHARILFPNKNFEPSRKVSYTVDEVILIMKDLGLEKDIDKVLPKKKPKKVVVTIEKPYPNPKWIFCLDPNGKKIRVPVKDSCNFSLGY